MQYRAGIITVSDKGFAGERQDESGRVIKEILQSSGYAIADYRIVPDEETDLMSALTTQTDELKADLILTTGGTGFATRDITPEATMKVIHRAVPGIAEAIRAYSMQITKRAMLSRAAAGIRNQTLIVNLPGSPKAVREALEYILPELEHGLGILTGREGECAR